jgi:hypothetical protein
MYVYLLVRMSVALAMLLNVAIMFFTVMILVAMFLMRMIYCALSMKKNKNINPCESYWSRCIKTMTTSSSCAYLFVTMIMCIWVRIVLGL